MRRITEDPREAGRSSWEVKAMARPARGGPSDIELADAASIPCLSRRFAENRPPLSGTTIHGARQDVFRLTLRPG
jgi:hypothetical protein